MDEEEEQRDAELANPVSVNDDDQQHERVGLFQFGGDSTGSLADETRELRHRVGGLDSDLEGDMSDASVGSLGMRMEMAFREDEDKYESKKRKRSAAPRRKAPKRQRSAPAAAADNEGDAVREELKAVPLDFGALAGAVDDDEPEPMPADVVDWDDVAEAEYNPDPDWCFLCRQTQRVVDVGDANPYLPDLIKHAEDNWVHVEHKELMRQLQDKYEKELRWTIEQVDQRLPWHKKTIFAHFTRHTKITRVKYEAESAACDEMIFTMMQEELFVKNKKTGRKNVNLKKLPQWFKLLAQQEKFEKTLKTMRPAQRVL